MNKNGLDLATDYSLTLHDHLKHPGEVPLHDAYDWGRRALTQGMGVVDVAVVHHRSLVEVLERLSTLEETARATREAAEVQAESLSVYEMALSGYRETNRELLHVNAELQARAAELAASNERYLELAAEQTKLAATERQARAELQHSHEELKRAQAQLVHSAKLAALGQLEAGVAHEINNPLAFVLNNLVVLQRHAQGLRYLIRLYQETTSCPAEEQTERLSRIEELTEAIGLDYALENQERIWARSREGLDRIRRIVEDLRAFSHEERGASWETTDLNDSLAPTLAIIQHRATMQKVEMEIELSRLPPVTCVPTQIGQVVLNLGFNAIDACGEGGRVVVRTRAVAEGVEIEVSDTGPGIDPSIRDRIFDPFFTTKPQGKGTGLGLSISHGIVEEHHGQIEVESTPGQGSRFVVRLPLRPPQT